MVKKAAEVINNDLVIAALRGLIGICVGLGAWFGAEVYSYTKENQAKIAKKGEVIARLEERSKYTSATLSEVNARQRRISEKLTNLLMVIQKDCK